MRTLLEILIASALGLGVYGFLFMIAELLQNGFPYDDTAPIWASVIGVPFWLFVRWGYTVGYMGVTGVPWAFLATYLLYSGVKKEFPRCGGFSFPIAISLLGAALVVTLQHIAWDRTATRLSNAAVGISSCAAIFVGVCFLMRQDAVEHVPRQEPNK